MSERNRYSFKNLELWKSAQDLAVEILTLADSLPTYRSADIIARQIIRSSTSIAANIAEGHGRFSFAAYRNHLSIAKGSAAETQGWIDLLVRRGHVAAEVGKQLDQKCSTLIAALTRRITALEAQERKPRLREERAFYDVDQVPGFEGSQVRADDEEVDL